MLKRHPRLTVADLPDEYTAYIDSVKGTDEARGWWLARAIAAVVNQHRATQNLPPLDAPPEPNHDWRRIRRKAPPAVVAAIRESNAPLADLAREYGISESYVSLIRAGKR